MNKIEDSKEEILFKALVKVPKGLFPYMELGKDFITFMDRDGDNFRLQIKKVVPKKSKNRPNGWKPESLSDIT